MMKGVRVEFEAIELVSIHRGLPLACELKGICYRPRLPLHFGEDVGVMARDIDELESAIIGGMAKDVVSG